ncbi:UNVERIFIED_CONTAM: hypothetical protein PYX00_011594 [Menopon gallinae]|uniref:ATP-dependent RNA helicase n=1 Tax=Menopon gallinae TaxID=328185 RepID=A0AAW2H7U7_9NEOP
MFDEKSISIFEDTSAVQRIVRAVAGEQQECLAAVDVFKTEDTRHESIVPSAVPYIPMPATHPHFHAKKYGFELDLFQKISLCALERGESVLVAAHTSSGKTAVAEYAIAMSIARNQRVVYTSPIKALSNQKYRELQLEFKDVGLMTGDVTLNPHASCIVMTTEILRNMLYRGSEVLREVSWVVFDEIHYMRDKERGVVWEETIILLPDHVRMVFLSATIPNAGEFARWVAKTHSQVVHVVYTEKRPTPLTHYVMPKGGRGLYKVKGHDDRTGRDVFDRAAFSKAMKSMGTKKRVDDSDMRNIIKILLEQKCLPTIVFSFSRKDCERFALAVENDFLGDEEKASVRMIFKNALSSLRREDRELPLIQNLLPLLLRGVGIHHSGLLPILKEIVEILFQENLLKILFATETFSIGLNMPAKSVVFTALKKFDGTERRVVSSGEYIQMSGRAGRRGIDEKGVVIAVMGDILTMGEGGEHIQRGAGQAEQCLLPVLNMVLNLMRVEGLDPLYLLSRSFFHFQKQNERMELERAVSWLYEKIPEEPVCGAEYFGLYRRRNELKMERNRELRNAMCQKSTSTPIAKGTVVDLFYLEDGVPYCVKTAVVNSYGSEDVECCFFADGGIVKKTFPADAIERVYKGSAKIETRTFFRKFEPLRLRTCLDAKIDDMEKELCSHENFVPFDRCLLCNELSKSCIKSCKFVDAFNRRLALAAHSAPVPGSEDSFLRSFLGPHPNTLVEFFRREKIRSIYESKYREYQKMVEIYHMEECQKMIKVLRRMEYCDEHSILEKGKIACEISSGDELILTEMIFNGEFSGMGVEDAVSLLSCFVFEEWQQEEVGVSEESLDKYKMLKATAQRIVAVLHDCNLRVDADAYVQKFSYELMDVVKMWVCGHTFLEICSRTPVFEGSIIRCFRRLEELLRQLCSAAREVCHQNIEEHCNKCQVLADVGDICERNKERGVHIRQDGDVEVLPVYDRSPLQVAVYVGHYIEQTHHKCKQASVHRQEGKKPHLHVSKHVYLTHTYCTVYQNVDAHEHDCAVVCSSFCALQSSKRRQTQWRPERGEFLLSDATAGACCLVQGYGCRVRQKELPMEEDIRSLLSTRKLSKSTIRELERRGKAARGFSYIPYLVQVVYDVPNLDRHPTSRILELLDRMFAAPQRFQREIGKIGGYLKARDDLFQAFLLFVENRRVKDDLYYWHPGIEHTNIFSFVCDLLGDVSSLILLHVTRSLIVDSTAPWSLVEMLEARLSPSVHSQISVMARDIEVFKDEAGGQAPRNNLPTAESTEFRRVIVSHAYWTDAKCRPFSFFEIEQPVHSDRKYFPCSCLSMVEVEFVGRERVVVLVTLKAFEDLLLKREDSKPYWVRLGIVDEDWEFVV